MRKFSTGDEHLIEDESFKNKTLRFTNNNFVGNNTKKESGTVNQLQNAYNQTGTFQGWDRNENGYNNKNNNDEDEMYESIEEEIIVNEHETPSRDNRKNKKANGNVYPLPLAPKSKS